MTELVSTVGAYQAMAAIPDQEARRTAWVEEYEAAYPEVFERYYCGWGNRDRRDDAADAAPQLAATITARESRLRALLTGLPQRLAPLGVEASNLPTVFLVGGHTSNGWSTSLHGRPTLFLALEYLTDGPGDEVLAVHEALHVIHRRRVRDTAGPSDTVALDLFSEGLAVAVTRLALPGLSDSEYLWFDDTHAEWARACEAQAARIHAFVAEHLDDPDNTPQAAGLFLNKPIEGLPTRCGYWLGDRMIRDWITAGATVPDLLDLPLPEAVERAHEWCTIPLT